MPSQRVQDRTLPLLQEKQIPWTEWRVEIAGDSDRSPSIALSNPLYLIHAGKPRKSEGLRAHSPQKLPVRVSPRDAGNSSCECDIGRHFPVPSPDYKIPYPLKETEPVSEVEYDERSRQYTKVAQPVLCRELNGED